MTIPPATATSEGAPAASIAIVLSTPAMVPATLGTIPTSRPNMTKTIADKTSIVSITFSIKE